MEKYDVRFNGDEVLAEMGNEFFEEALYDEYGDDLLKASFTIEANDGYVWVDGQVNDKAFYYDIDDEYDGPDGKAEVYIMKNNMSRKEELMSFGFNEDEAKYAMGLGL